MARSRPASPSETLRTIEVASKYAAILPNLPELPAQDTNYQDKINLFKQKLRDDPDFEMTPVNLGKRYSAARARKDQIEDELYQANLEIEAFTQMLVNTQEANNPEWGTHGAPKNTLRLINGDKLEVRKEPYAVVEDRDANRKWAIANELERHLTLPWQTVNSITKQKLLAGEAEPDGVKVFVKSKVVFTPMKSGE